MPCLPKATLKHSLVVAAVAKLCVTLHNEIFNTSTAMCFVFVIFFFLLFFQSSMAVFLLSVVGCMYFVSFYYSNQYRNTVFRSSLTQHTIQLIHCNNLFSSHSLLLFSLEFSTNFASYINTYTATFISIRKMPAFIPPSLL